MAQAPILTLSPAWEVSQSFPENASEGQLGDGYTINSAYPSLREEWAINRRGLSTTELNTIVDQLTLYEGVTSFQWSPLFPNIPRKLFFCSGWTTTPLGPDTWDFSATFIEDIEGECLAYSALLDENDIETKLINGSTFITDFTDNTGDYLINSDNDLVLRSLHTHSDTIPDEAGTLYDQVWMALGCISAYEYTNTAIWLTRAEAYGQAILDNYYNSTQGQGTIWLPNWLYDIKGDDRLEDGTTALATGEVKAPFAWLPMLWELYDKLYSLTSNSQWDTAANLTKEDAIALASFTTQTYIYRENNGSVTELAGTEITGTATRVSGGIFDKYVQVSGSGDLEVQNVDLQIAIANDTTFVASAGSSITNQVIEFFVSTSTDDESETQIYKQFWRLGNANAVNTKTFAKAELYRWDDLVWYYGIGATAGTYESASVTGSITGVVLNASSETTLTLNKSARNPFKFYVLGNGIIRLQDFGDKWWDYSFNLGSWTLLDLEWSDFSWSSINGTPAIAVNTNGNIKSLKLVPTTNIYVWWVGIDEPEVLPVSFVYRAGIRDKNSGTKTLYVGDVRLGATDTLNYTPGTVPFTRTVTSGVAGEINGSPQAGYQNVWGWAKWSETDELNNTVTFLEASQNAYAIALGESGPFRPVYSWTTNTFSGADTGLNQAQVGAWLARAWYETRSQSLGTLTMNWLKWLDQVYATREDTQPPVSFPADAVAIAGEDPGVQALIGEAALWANLAGGDPSITFRWINRTITYLDGEFIPAGVDPMAGSWSSGQPTFGTLNEYYGWWHGACIRFYSLLLLNKSTITYPPCSEPLTIPTSDPIERQCCSGPVIDCGIYFTWNNSSPAYNPTTSPLNNCKVDIHLGEEFASNGGATINLFFATSSTNWLGIQGDRVVSI
jgi:hypothetical protein